MGNDGLKKRIKPEYVYLTIPSCYVCVYHKILAYMADFGRNIVEDCTASCKGTGKNIMSCWNLFQCAVACYELNRKKEADFFIDYIKKQLTQLYKGSGLDEYNGIHKVKVSPDGKVMSFVTCGSEDAEFYIDNTKGEILKEKSAGSKYEINEKGELIYKHEIDKDHAVF